MFEDNLEIAYCPDEFQNNCNNFPVMCTKCKAATPLRESDSGAYCEMNKKFYYRPTRSVDDLNYQNHPYNKKLAEDRREIKKRILEEEKASKNTELAKKSRRYNRQGKSIERKVIKSIDGAKLTSTSGSTNHDGDGYIFLGETRYRFSHKQRFSKRNELGPTSKEWSEGEGEGADIWLTTSNTYGTIVTMPKNVFDELIQLIKEKNA